MNGTPSAISPRFVALTGVALAVLFAVGVLSFGLGGGAQAAAAAQGGCVTGTFALDAAEQRRQVAFEARLGAGAELPALGFHTTPPDMTAAVHAASHAYVVVFYRHGTDTTALRALAADATARQIPLLAAPRAQKPALVAVTQNLQLTCDAPRVDALREFAAPYYSGLAQ